MPAKRNPTTLSDELLELLRLLWAVDHGVQSTSKRMLARMGITGPQRFVIRLLGRHPGLSARELASALHIHPSTLTGVLRRLEDSGFVRRSTDPEDGRRVILQLTAAGRRLDRPAEGTVEEILGSVLREVRREDMAATRRVLTLLAERFREDTP